MFSIENYIDSFQHTKKIITDKVISDPVLNEVANKFIKEQTAFAKMLTTNTEKIIKYYVDSNTKVLFPKD